MIFFEWNVPINKLDNKTCVTASRFVTLTQKKLHNSTKKIKEIHILNKISYAVKRYVIIESVLKTLISVYYINIGAVNKNDKF